MAIIALNLATVEAWDGSGGGMLEPGEYTFQVTAAEQKQSKNGNGQLEVTFTVVDETENKGRTIKSWYMFNDTGAKRLRALVDATGAPLNAAGQVDDQSFVGGFLIAEVYQDEYPAGTDVEGKAVMKKSTKLRCERSAAAAETGAAAFAAAAPAAPAAPAPVARPAAQVARPAPSFAPKAPAGGLRPVAR